ncbi:hypothetical protein FA95DRAFT_1566973 [Auriscalpium vulgare]|uniref:Uncharacterized protein n=1 Tax=Auriscalpium vulgare TaxID=40419 RepID=A0ACB8R6E6_9AGAM|nr:hypothetical protein FA95DRAFT_1566973 [Auriscalpium vulgare]
MHGMPQLTLFAHHPQTKHRSTTPTTCATQRASCADRCRGRAAHGPWKPPARAAVSTGLPSTRIWHSGILSALLPLPTYQPYDPALQVIRGRHASSVVVCRLSPPRRDPLFAHRPLTKDRGTRSLTIGREALGPGCIHSPPITPAPGWRD